MVSFFMHDPELDPDEFRKEMIATGRCSPNDDIRLVRCLTRAEAARLGEGQKCEVTKLDRLARSTPDRLRGAFSFGGLNARLAQ